MADIYKLVSIIRENGVHDEKDLDIEASIKWNANKSRDISADREISNMTKFVQGNNILAVHI